MLEERKELNLPENANRVTVIIWPASGSDPKSAGHVALQTYYGGPEEKGIYVSFWPGETCNKSYSQQDPAPAGQQNQCNNSGSHFHTKIQDNLIYHGYHEEGGGRFDLYELDVAA